MGWTLCTIRDESYWSLLLVQIVAFVIIAVASASALEADRYPAGVNPALCPGYPLCDNSLLHSGIPSQWTEWAAPVPSHLEINGVGGDR